MRHEVVLKSDVWSNRRLFYQGMLFGCLAFWLWFAVFAFVAFGKVGSRFGDVRIIIGASLVFMVAGPLLMFERYRFQFGSSSRALLGGLGFGIGFVATPGIAFAAMAITGGARQADLPTIARMLLIITWVALAYPMMAVAAWWISRHRSPTTLIQDGTLCPSCGYCLRGSRSTRCPECGHRYREGALGTADARCDVDTHRVRLRDTPRAVALTIILLGMAAAVYWIYDVNLLGFLVLVSAIGCAVDAHIISLNKHHSTHTFSPLLILAAVCLFWVVCFPWYLVMRRKVVECSRMVASGSGAEDE